MSTMWLELVEPVGRPTTRVHEVVEGQVVTIYALPLTPDAPKGLRRTVLRSPEIQAPAGSTTLLSVRLERSGMSVLSVGTGVVLELRRASRHSQVVVGIRLPLQAQLGVVLPDQSRLSVSMILQREVDRGAAFGVAGSGTRTSRIRYAADNAWWILVDMPDIFISAGQRIWDSFQDKLMKAGVDSQALMMGIGFLATAGIGAGFTYYFYSKASDQEARAETAESALDRAKSAQAASLATELACLAERQKLVEEVGDIDRKASLAVESALMLPLANTIAVELGGTRMASDAVMAMDALARANMVSAIVGRLGTSAGDGRICLGQARALGHEIPRYVLLWHPDPTQLCPNSYASEAEGVHRLGRWGLSDRVAREFGAAGHANTGAPEGTLEKLLNDPRHETRWSAFTLVSAYRSIQDALLMTQATSRPPVLPSQVQLWTLALLDAYNRLPSTAGGAMDGDARECVDHLINTRLADEVPAAPGEPLLPELSKLATGDAVLEITPTARCPWTSARLAQGADAALRAVARLADTQLGTSAKGGE